MKSIMQLYEIKT